MTLQYTYTYNFRSSLFSFCETLSRWNDYTLNETRYDFYMNQIGCSLTDTENDALSALSRLLQEHSEEIVPAIFLLQEDTVIENRFLIEALDQCAVFESRFKHLWPKIEQGLQNKIEKLSDIDIHEGEIILQKLFTLRDEQLNIPIVLLPSSPEKNDLQALYWPKENFLTIECALLPHQLIPFLIFGVIMHETIHFILHSDNIKDTQDIFKDYTREGLSEKDTLLFLEKLEQLSGLPKEVLLEEFFVSSLLPEGFLYKKLTGKHIPLSNTSYPEEKYRHDVATSMENTLKKYISEGKSIDKNYLKELLMTIKEKGATQL